MTHKACEAPTANLVGLTGQVQNPVRIDFLFLLFTWGFKIIARTSGDPMPAVSIGMRGVPGHAGRYASPATPRLRRLGMLCRAERARLG